MTELNGKVVVVTGAARGIGQEFARAFGAAGARIVACDINDCAETLALVKEAGAEGLAARLDVTDAAAAAAVARTAAAAFGRIDALINNAALYGALKGGRFDAIAEADWDATMAVNVKGIWNCCKAVVPAMRRGGGGSIVNISSLAATYGMPFGLHYTVSKAAVIGLTRGLARELGRDDIRVNAIAPSAVMTEGTREFFADKHDRALAAIKAGQTLQRNLEAADLVGTALWLVSSASAFVTGQTIAVDGGTVML
jgi:NAD(P)-dependent dehydrogenase (short-subunit alcohol dehydrogenase family)